MSDRGYSSENPGFVKGSATSRAASHSMKPHASTIAAALFAVIAEAKRYGCTSDEAAEKVGLPNLYSSRPRIAELRKKKKIIDSGRVRRNRSGRLATIWVLPEYHQQEAAHG